jgi:ATP diphosphatase
VQKRAARVGFDWPDAAGPRQKITEELGELDAAISAQEMAAELGDLLFSVVNLARHLIIDPNPRFGCNCPVRDAFRRIESLAERPLDQFGIDALEQLWQRAKRDLAS